MTKLGDRYGKLTIIDRHNGIFVCLCVCGLERQVNLSQLMHSRNPVNNCGKRNCRKRADKKLNQTVCKEGLSCFISLKKPKVNKPKVKKAEVFPNCPISSHPLYSTWNGMKDRCNNPSNPNYKNYGGRGIKVCDRWMNSFFHFVKDVGIKINKEYSLDRIDNNGNYAPTNCRWATSKQQSNNRRTNKQITFNGQTKNITEWAKQLNISVGTLSCVLAKYDANTVFPVLRKYI
ncbi:MAG: hypothetical protein AAFV71_26275 [Cyanobacteria bacterium J06633_8]